MGRGPLRHLLVLVLFLIGCTDASGSDATVDANSEPLELVTFNAALGVGLADYPEERLTALLQALPELSADVVCLQEIWQVAQVMAITEGVRSSFPYTFHSMESQGTLGQRCGTTESAALNACLEASCAEVLDDQLVECAIESCATVFASVSTECQSCLISNQALPLSQLMDACSATGATSNAPNQNGLLILSRLPLLDTDFVVLDSSLGERGVLLARVQTEIHAAIELFCTHLGATQSSIQYSGSHGSWEGERLVQTQQLLEVIGARRDDRSLAVLLGDMNSGPATASADAESPEAFELIRSHGLSAPYVDHGEAACTWCPENPLTEDLSPNTSGSVIDHIFVSPLSDRVQSIPIRMFDDPIVIDVAGEALETHLSDHFGIMLTLALDP